MQLSSLAVLCGGECHVHVILHIVKIVLGFLVKARVVGHAHLGRDAGRDGSRDRSHD